jgi:DNA-3-methyladenine glycosylase
MGIDLRHNRLDLLGTDLFLEDAPAVSSRQVARGPRIGVDYSGVWAKKPYRLWVKGNPHVSRAKVP